MKAFCSVLLIGLGVFVLFFGLPFMIYGSDFALYQFFAPKKEAVRREVFEQSKAYNQGMIQELQNMQFAYLRTQDPKTKESLADIILHRAADYDVNKMPEDLRIFISDLKTKQSN